MPLMSYLLPQLTERVAARDPERDAFKVPIRGLGYGELERRSNQLAHLLREEGVRRGDRVGIFMPRDLRSAISVYGIMKAGAAFVPIDPHVPAEGLRRLIQDCGLRLLITDRPQRRTLRHLATLGLGEGTSSLLGIDAGDSFTDGGPGWRSRPWSDLDAHPDGAAPDVPLMEDDLAYLMYSSGSTGRPKGIVHTHRSGLAYARLSAETYGVTAEDRIGNHSPLHFDMSTFGYFTAPLAGATTVLVPEAHTKLAASLSQLMETERLTIWYSVPLALIQLLSRGVLESRDLTSLRWVLFGGEPFARQHLHALMRLWPQARFSNVYGPAEVNQCTFHHLPASDATDIDESEPVPIGRVWSNTEGLVLDAEDRPVTSGEVGELVIRSPTMMQGYWGRPERNARAFYRRPREGFEHVFYRTGDLVEAKPDGELLFLGRKDRQVKVRGHRLELDEIERTLAAHPAVQEAAVFPVRAQSGDELGQVRGLHAAVSLKGGEEVSSEQLSTFLGAQVSGYAVPQRLDIVRDFPRTSSGKIDRRRLQALAEDAVT